VQPASSAEPRLSLCFDVPRTIVRLSAKEGRNKVAGQDDEIRLQLVDKQNCSGNRFAVERWMIVEVAEMRDREVVETEDAPM